MPLLLVALAALGLWFWLSKRRKKIPAPWIGALGTLIGTVLMVKGMPIVGALMTAAAGLWLRYGNMLMPGETPPPSPEPTRIAMSRADAADLLGVATDADRETILIAYRRLMTRNHPDAGGSVGLAARINAARDLLLKSHEL